jgi:hypothetical protein
MRALALEQRADGEAQLLQWLRSRGLTRLALIEAEMVHEQQKWQLEWVRRVVAEIESGQLEWDAGLLEPRGQGGREVPRWLKELNEEVQP